MNEGHFPYFRAMSRHDAASPRVSSYQLPAGTAGRNLRNLRNLWMFPSGSAARAEISRASVR